MAEEQQKIPETETDFSDTGKVSYLDQYRDKFRIEMQPFEGPLDLLFALITQNEMDIFSVSLAKITEDYLAYVNTVQLLELDLAGEFLVVASTLIQMKARALLPVEPEVEEEDQNDPALLARKLEEYKKYQQIAEVLREQEKTFQQIHFRKTDLSKQLEETVEFYDLTIYDLFSVFKKVLSEIGEQSTGIITDEDWTVDEKIVEMEELLQGTDRANLTQYLLRMKAKLEVIVTFLALLELMRLRRIIARQSSLGGDIWILRPDHMPVAAPEEHETE